MLKLFDLYPDWLSGDGIFNYMSGDLPWSLDESSNMNIMYFSRSGGKYVSALLRHLQADGVLSPENKQRIADIILLQCLPKWRKIWATMVLEYNPIENYNMVEQGEQTTNYGKQVADELVKAGTLSTSHGEKVETVGEAEGLGSSTQIGSMSAFNASAFQNTGQTTTQISSWPVTTDTVEHSGSDVDTYNLTDTRTVSDSGSDVAVNTLSRSGNVGVTTTQQMIEQERAI